MRTHHWARMCPDNATLTHYFKKYEKNIFFQKRSQRAGSDRRSSMRARELAMRARIHY